MPPVNHREAKKREIRMPSFDRLETLVDELMEELMGVEDFEELPQQGGPQGRGPVIFGFSLRFDAEGRPKIEEFGSVQRRADRLVPGAAREPLVDVMRNAESVTISAELPGVNRKELRVRGTRSSVVIDVQGEKPYYKEIALGERIEPGSVKALFNNGILEVNLKTVKPARGGKEIAVH